MQAVAAATAVEAEELVSEAAATVSQAEAAATVSRAEAAATVSQVLAPLERTRALAEADCPQNSRIRCSPCIRQRAAGMSNLSSHG